jgi:hypothetical protein
MTIAMPEILIMNACQNRKHLKTDLGGYSATVINHTITTTKRKNVTIGNRRVNHMLLMALPKYDNIKMHGLIDEHSVYTC